MRSVGFVDIVWYDLNGTPAMPQGIAKNTFGAHIVGAIPRKALPFPYLPILGKKHVIG